MFDRYISDLASMIEQQVLNGWLAGKMTLQAEGEARGRLIAYRLLLEGLRLEVLRENYGLPAVPDDTR